MSNADAPLRPRSHHTTNQAVLRLLLAGGHEGRRFVDIGSGEGYFPNLVAKELRQRGGDPMQQMVASEIYTGQFRCADVSFVPLVPERPLPFADGSFDVTTCIEVIEHVENQFALIRELVRITKPGGTIIVTTPNIMSVTSRLGVLANGFADMYSAEAVQPDEPGLGHIHPVGPWYLWFQFARASVEQVEFQTDRRKHSAVVVLPLVIPFIALRSWWFRLRLARKYPKRLAEQRHILGALNSMDVLLGRTLIAVGKKPLR